MHICECWSQVGSHSIDGSIPRSAISSFIPPSWITCYWDKCVHHRAAGKIESRRWNSAFIDLRLETAVTPMFCYYIVSILVSKFGSHDCAATLVGFCFARNFLWLTHRYRRMTSWFERTMNSSESFKRWTVRMMSRSPRVILRTMTRRRNGTLKALECLQVSSVCFAQSLYFLVTVRKLCMERDCCFRSC